jgi:hypothetical protein
MLAQCQCGEVGEKGLKAVHRQAIRSRAMGLFGDGRGRALYLGDDGDSQGFGGRPVVGADAARRDRRACTDRRERPRGGVQWKIGRGEPRRRSHASEREVGVGDGEREVLGHLVFADDGTGLEGNLAVLRSGFSGSGVPLITKSPSALA